MKLSNKFIKRSDELCNFEKAIPAPYFRKEFELDFVPEKAEITITGCGYYELYINGKNITKGPLAPYTSNVEQTLYYDNYDIAKHLVKGKNALGVLLGNGMRNAFGGFVWDFEKDSLRGPLCLALAVEASKDDKTFLLEADESFKVHNSPVLYDDIRLGYIYDSNKELDGWNEVGFDDRDWDFAQKEYPPQGEPVLCTVPPITVTQKVKPVKIEHFDKLAFCLKSTLTNETEPVPETVRENVYVYDFPFNAAGVSVFKINGKPGQKITVRHGELKTNGKFNQRQIMFLEPGRDEKYYEYFQKDVFICKGGEEIFVPKFKYDGFQYLFVEGLEENQATLDAFEFWVMNSDLKERATFNCSNDTLNKLFEMTRRSDLSNFYYYPTDCPQREKNGWTGDASMSAEHLILSLDCESSLREWLRSNRNAQQKNGAIFGIVPTGSWGVVWGNGPTWDSVLFNLPYEIYRRTGDKGVIEENVQAWIRYLSYSTTRKNENGTVSYGLGDWMDPFESENKKIMSPLEVTDTIMMVLNAKKAAFMLNEIGRTYERDFAQKIADDYKKAVRDNLIDFDTMTVKGDCQTSQCFAIEAGIFEEDELPKAKQKLLSIVHRDNDLNACGMLGLRYIFHSLCNMGEYDLAYRMITSKTRLGYGYWVELGLTTLAENFFYEDGREMNSLNHHFLGDILSIFIQEFAGIKPNPTYTDIHSFVLSPCFVTDLKFAESTYNSIDGKISCRWERIDDTVKLSVTVPEGQHGKLVLRDKTVDGKTEIELKAGKQEFIIK